ncbi:PadR family transcriptional regulator [Cryptosporangium sp. NPDC048952]|uniref:PadR family transcriptional regulator n=1 Tax=Cryptosporangium sp. NPDC048952 TaxID=3363961 RepID=UPI003723EF67
MPTALTKADRDVTALTVLGLLLTGPRHTYEMHRLIERTHKDYVTGLPRSVYHAVERLLTGGYVEIVDTVRDGPRPERTVYRLTAAGESRLHEWVERLLAEPEANSTLFVPALSFAGCLPPATVAAALQRRRDALARRSASAEAFPAELPRVLGLEAEYEVSRLRAEQTFVSNLIDDLERGRLTWSPEPPDPADIDRLIEEDGK